MDWADADLVLANSTCFDTALLHKLAHKCRLLKKGTWIFSLSRKIPNVREGHDFVPQSKGHDFECVMSIDRPMSWGTATVHIQRKIR